jgi:hypothetical protein
VPVNVLVMLNLPVMNVGQIVRDVMNLQQL